MDEKYLEIISRFDEEDQRLLRTYLKTIFNYKDSKEAEAELTERLKQAAADLKKIEERALKRLKAEQSDPTCSFCGKKASQVDRMFAKSEYLHICSECVSKCYHELDGN